MNWTNIRLIFLREVRDQLRDRRTLFMVAVLPLLLYPALGIGLFQMMTTFTEQTRNVVLIGADEIPAPELIRDHRFVKNFFSVPANAEKLRVITDDPASLENEELDEKARARFREFLAILDQERETLGRLAFVQEQLYSSLASSEQTAEWRTEEQELRKQVTSWFSSAPAQVLVVFPPGFQKRFQELSAQLSSGQFPPSESTAGPQVILLHNSADDKSEIAYQRVKHALGEWEQALLTKRLKDAGLPLSLPDPVPSVVVDLAEADEIAANVWSKIFPAILVIMAVTGAFYPAIDLGAGEKERGTMETLLISPATRTEIVLGKFLTVMLFSISTALLNLTSMGLTGKNMIPAMGGGASSSPIGDLAFPPFSSLIWVVLLAIPLSALFSALSLSLAMFAKSSKEGQYFLTPLLMVAMGLTMFCLNPAQEIEPFNSVLPVAGPALLLKALLLGGSSASAVLVYVVPVLVTSFMYSALALWWAIDQFQSESILFRDSERFELGLWLKQLLKDKEQTPSFMEAGVCFVLIALLQFIFMTSMQKSPELFSNPTNMITVQLIYLIATVGVPPAMMAIMLTTRPWLSLKLRFPSWQMLALSIVLPLTLQPLSLSLLAWLDPFFPAIPAGAEQMLKAMSTIAVPFWLTFATFAIAPAVCEELAFRGFILTGLQRSRHKWLPIVVSALLFGGIHMIPKQQFNASLLGLVLGLLAVRSQSLIPGVIFHAIFNGTQVIAARLPEQALQGEFARYFITISSAETGSPQLVFNQGFLLACGLLSAAMLYYLLRHNQSREDSTSSPQHSNALLAK